MTAPPPIVTVLEDEELSGLAEIMTENTALRKIISDIVYVAEFGHPALSHRDDAKTLEWIIQNGSPWVRRS